MRVWASVLVLGVSGAIAAPASLTPSTPLSGTLQPGDVTSGAVNAPSGSRLRLTVRQRRVDVAVQVTAPSGAVLGTVTNASHRTDPVTLTLITQESGAHRVEVRLEKPDSHPGAFQLSLDPIAPRQPRQLAHRSGPLDQRQQDPALTGALEDSCCARVGEFEVLPHLLGSPARRGSALVQ